MTRGRKPNRLSTAAYEALVKAGAPAEMLLAALKAERIEEDRKQERARHLARMRQRKHRASRPSRESSVTERDQRDNQTNSSSSPDAPTLFGPSDVPVDRPVADAAFPPMVSLILPSLTPVGGVGDGSARASANKQSEEGEVQASPQSPQSTVLIGEEAKAIADEVMAAKLGFDLKFVSPNWCQTAYEVQGWLDAGATREIILLAIDRGLASLRRQGSGAASPRYFTPIVMREIVETERRVAAMAPQRDMFPKDRLHVVEGGHATDRQAGAGDRRGRQGNGGPGSLSARLRSGR